MSIIDAFMAARLGKLNWLLIKTLSKIPLIKFNLVIVKKESAHDDDSLSIIEKSDEAIQALKTQVTKYKKEGYTEHFFASKFQVELQKHNIDSEGVLKLIYNLWHDKL